MEHYPRVEKVQKLFSLSIHDDTSSHPKEEVIFNAERFPELNVRAGDLVQISAILDSTISKSSEKKASGLNGQHDGTIKSPMVLPSITGDSATTSRRISSKTYDENGALISGSKEPDSNRQYVFLVHDLTQDQKTRYPNVDLSISQGIAQIFGFRKWMPVLVSVIHEDQTAASHVEIIFRDQYLSRADMWRLAISELSQRTVYRDQKLLFLDTIKATVKNVYRDGEKRKWGYFGRNTKPIFRSESARFVVFIQMSREMWEFDVEGGGEIMFNKVVNGFLPELFKSWLNLQARHLVSIVLFSRMEYDGTETADDIRSDFESSSSEPKSTHRDFYRVVVNDWSSNDWVRILDQLKREFRVFLRDITIQHAVKEDGISSTEQPEYMIAGRPSIASKGNILEAISLASTHFSQDYIDRDLVRTGISVVVITAGTGIYEVEYPLLKLSTDTLIGSGIGIDLVCLSPMPLHSIPLFKYRNPRLVETKSRLQGTTMLSSSMENTPKQSDFHHLINDRPSYSLNRQASQLSDPEPLPGEWSYAIPHWIDVSFWKGTVDEQSSLHLHKNLRTNRKQTANHDRSFALRCVLYELEMMGFMENELANIGIQHVHEHPMHPWNKLQHRQSGRPISQINWKELSDLDRTWMENYDDHIFKPLHARREAELAAIRKNAPVQAGNKADALKSLTPILEPRGEPTRTVSATSRGNVGFLDWKLTQANPGRIDMPKRKASVMSFASVDRDSIKSTTSGFSRANMTVGPIADFSKGHDDIKPAILVSGATTADKSTGWSVAALSERLRSALGGQTPVSKESTSSAASLLNIKAATPTKVDGKAKPIDIAKTRKPPVHSTTSTNNNSLSSTDTVKDHRQYPRRSSITKSTNQDESGGILHIASNIRRIGPKLSTSNGDVPAIPTTLSPISSLAPWLVLVNPSNPKKNKFNTVSQFRRWQHVFPKQLKASSMKWKSLSSPASVPLTNDFFPSEVQLENEYHQHPYKITQNTDEDMLEVPRSREALVQELIAFRLAHGFQLTIGPAVIDYLGRGPEEVNIFDKDYMTKDGDTVFMTIGNIIHQVSCVSSGGIEIKRFTRKPTAEVEMSESNNTLEYHPYIRTALSTSYTPRDISFKRPQLEYNWNYVDSFIAGHETKLSDQLRFWRARFVFIPVDIPFRRSLPMVTEDSEEEIRLEGIRKLTHIWNRNRVYSPEERGYSSFRRRKDHNPLQIDYQTRDPSAVIAAGPEGSLIAETDALAQRPAIFSETEQYSTANFDFQKLAQDVQGEKGVKMIDRRWHLKLYHSCFVGFDLVSWLLEHFRDIETRDDAVAFGRELMDKKLFKHVREEHVFRDGNFFYHITSEYRIPRSGSGWWSGRREKSSVPSTPMSDLNKLPYMSESSHQPSTSSSSDTSDEKSSHTEGTQRKYVLSGMMRYNVDSKKHSYRPEIINLHYDRLHSPDNCYHFRIDWMNVTTKFIEDAVYDWAVHGKKYGLKLIQIPIAEAGSIMESRPFREPYAIKLAVQPPGETHTDVFDASSFGPQTAKDNFIIHKAILKRLNFVLDFESLDSFPGDVDVVYSWGKNDYNSTQFVHRSGTMLAQITQDGDFILLPNRLYNDRLSAFKLEKMEPPPTILDRRTGGNARHTLSPMASPLVRPVPDPADSSRSKTLTAEQIKDEVETFCHNEKALKAFYADLPRRRSSASTSPSPMLNSSTVLSESTVPSLRLPPRGPPGGQMSAPPSGSLGPIGRNRSSSVGSVSTLPLRK